METIVKGKHIKYEYFIVNYLDFRLSIYKPKYIFFYDWYDWYDDNKRIKQFNDGIDDLKKTID